MATPGVAADNGAVIPAIFSPHASHTTTPYIYVRLLHSAILFMKITIIRDLEYSKI